MHRDESRTQGLDRLELIRFLQVAQTISVHHGALAYLLGINALRASEAAAVRIEDYAETLRGHRVLEACRGERTEGPLVLRPNSGKPIDRRDVRPRTPPMDTSTPPRKTVSASCPRRQRLPLGTSSTGDATAVETDVLFAMRVQGFESR